MSRSRHRRSFCKHRRIRHRTPSATLSGNRSQFGSAMSTAAKISVTVSPPMARRLVRTSYSTHPNDQISVRVSSASPRTCSGLMYGTVPITTPGCVAAAVTVSVTPPADVASCFNSFASPKSSTFTLPSAPSLTLPGFRSRCMIPFSCADSSASAICLHTSIPSRRAIGFFFSRSARVSPSTSSSTSRVAPLTSSNPWMAAMLG